MCLYPCRRTSLAPRINIKQLLGQVLGRGRDVFPEWPLHRTVSPGHNLGVEVRPGGEWSPAAQHGVEEDAQRPAVEIAVNFLLGFLNRHLVGPLLELHILHADRGALRLHLSMSTSSLASMGSAAASESSILRLAAESSFLAF